MSTLVNFGTHFKKKKESSTPSKRTGIQICFLHGPRISTPLLARSASARTPRRIDLAPMGQRPILRIDRPTRPSICEDVETLGSWVFTCVYSSMWYSFPGHQTPVVGSGVYASIFFSPIWPVSRHGVKNVQPFEVLVIWIHKSSPVLPNLLPS